MMDGRADKTRRTQNFLNIHDLIAMTTTTSVAAAAEFKTSGMDFFCRFYWRANDAAFKLMRTHGSPLPPPPPRSAPVTIITSLTIINSGRALGSDPIDAKRTDSHVRGASLISPIVRVYPTSSRGRLHASTCGRRRRNFGRR